MAAYVLKLFICGRTLKAERSIADLQRIFDQELAGDYDFTVIDILDQPHLAEEERIMATPTLIMAVPKPRRLVVGDFSDSAKVLQGLNL